MENKVNITYVEKLAKLVFVAGILAIVLYVGNYFSSVLADIGVAIVVSMIAKPLMELMRKVKIKGKSAPDWALALFSIILILLVLTGLFAGLVPVVAKVAANIGNASSNGGMFVISANLANINGFLVKTFNLDNDFCLESSLVDLIRSASNFGAVKTMLGSVASTTINFFVGLFSVVFISFFLIKDKTMLSRIFLSLTPDRLEEKVSEALANVENLLSRYFLGLLIEVVCVGFIDFVGLWLIAGLDFESSVGVGFFVGMLNIIPYIGPVLGCIFGTSMGVIINFAGVGAGAGGTFWTFIVIVLCIFVVSNLIDEFVFQPIIYSRSIQSHPLEIFIVLLLAGTISGVVGMLVAIPVYTVLRVVAIKFFPDVKFIRALASYGNGSKSSKSASGQ